jgi:hypothetical protein
MEPGFWKLALAGRRASRRHLWEEEPQGGKAPVKHSTDPRDSKPSSTFTTMPQFPHIRKPVSKGSGEGKC